MSTFDIINDPWLDVLRIDGTAETVSLRQSLTDAHVITRVSEPSPLTEVALLRFLNALASDGLREQISSEEEWAPFVENLRGGLSTHAVGAILAPLKGRSDVLDPEHDGFFDGPAVRSVPGWNDPQARQTVSRVLPEIPTGTNLAHFVHTSDDASALCVGCLLKSRAIDAAFARGGLGPSISRNLLATITGTEPRYVVPSGRTLLETLLLNVVIGDDSRPSWCSIHTHEDGEPGPIARLTWRPRLMMPIASSESDLPCIRCATINRPRFAYVVLVDTYNHQGSPFGSKSDVEQWKVSVGDPHLIPSVKDAINLGINHDEWPLRSITRLLGGEASALLDNLSCRSTVIGDQITISVTASAGNQAKVDDAPHVAVNVPSALLARSSQDRVRIATALATIFEKTHRDRKRQLIPDAVPQLLSDLAVVDEPEAVVEEWVSKQPIERRQHVASDDDAALRKVVKGMIGRLGRLSSKELAALRLNGKCGAVADAARQKAFEAVWFESRLPSGYRRHALREALVTVASIYAAHPDHHHGLATRFGKQLQDRLNAERKILHKPNSPAPVKRLLSSVITSSSGSRDVLLMRLVDELLDGGPNQAMRSINFADLLLEVARWNDPVDPTPARWQRLLQST